MTMLRGMLSQGLGHVSGPHSAFIPYHVDGITLQTVGDGWHDEMSLGRTVESVCRSLNNLLEHLHQSFFFYLLMQANRFVSIGTYLPSAMLIAANFTLTSIVLWVQSGRPGKTAQGGANSDEKTPLLKEGSEKKVDEAVATPKTTDEVVERHLFLPVGFITAVHFVGLLPLWIFNTAPQSVSLYFLRPPRSSANSYQTFVPFYVFFTILTLLIPHIASLALTKALPHKPTSQEITLLQCFSLLLHGLFLSALATLNFSLSLMIGLLSVPFSFVRPSKNILLVALMNAFLVATAPPVVMGAVVLYMKKDVAALLAQASFGWHVWGMWTQVIVWLVWWPAWVIAGVVAANGLY